STGVFAPWSRLSRTAPRPPSGFASTCRPRRSLAAPTSSAPSHSPAGPGPAAREGEENRVSRRSARTSRSGRHGEKREGGGRDDGYTTGIGEFRFTFISFDRSIVRVFSRFAVGTLGSPAGAASILGFGGGSLAFALLGVEDLLDRQPEEAGDAKGQGEAGVVLSGFDGVDGLARDLQTLGQVAL